MTLRSDRTATCHQLQMEQETELKAAFEARMAELEAAFKGDMAELQPRGAGTDTLRTPGMTFDLGV